MVPNFLRALKKALPNMLTLGNGISGFSALICAAMSFADKSNSAAYTCCGVGLIVLAMIFDALDGRVARMTGSSSNIGAQLDSLCDAISFGVGPALLLFFALMPSVLTLLVWVAGACYMSCAVYRLARFNVETTDHSEESHLWFSGLPSPAAALLVCLTLVVFCNLPATSQGIAGGAALIISTTAALLMVSRVKVPHLGMVIRMIKGRR